MTLLIMIIFLCAASTLTYSFEAESFFQRMSLLYRYRSSNDFRRSIFGLAELYHYINGQNIITNEDQRDKRYFLDLLKTTANFIAREDNPQIYIQMLLHSLKEVDCVTSKLFATWSNEFASSQELHEPYERLELFFRRQISGYSHEIGSAIVIRTLTDANGLCNIFHYPSKIFQLLSDKFANFSKLAYLVHQFSKLNMYPEMDNLDKSVLALKKLGFACELLKDNTFSDDRRKAFLLAILNNDLEKSIVELNSYDLISSLDNICAKLEHYGIPALRNRFVDQYSIALFLHECLDDLAQRWSLAYNNSEIQKHQAALISRWFDRLEKYVKRTGDEQFTKSDNYLKQLVDEVPAQAAKLAFEQGCGLCSTIAKGDFVVIGRHFDLMNIYSKTLGFKSLPSEGVYMNDLINFKYIRTVCFRRSTLFCPIAPQNSGKVLKLSK